MFQDFDGLCAIFVEYNDWAKKCFIRFFWDQLINISINRCSSRTSFEKYPLLILEVVLHRSKSFGLRYTPSSGFWECITITLKALLWCILIQLFLSYPVTIYFKFQLAPNNWDKLSEKTLIELVHIDTNCLNSFQKIQVL